MPGGCLVRLWLRRCRTQPRLWLVATDRICPSKEGKANGVAILHGARASKGTDGIGKSGVYSVDWDCEGPGKQAETALDALRKKGVKDLVWEHTNGEFERIKAGTGLAV